MKTKSLVRHGFGVDEWFVEPLLNRLTNGEKSVTIELKAMDVLVCLAERPGSLLTRKEIVDAVWATEYISDNTLTHAISRLRKALGDDARDPTVIETIHRRGYRLAARVTFPEPPVCPLVHMTAMPEH